MRATGLLVLAAAAAMGSACGDNQVTPVDSALPDMGGIGTQCDDGIDNDGDGLVDYPEDPGCAVPNADDETDDCPSGPACPQCANDRDDDGNGSTDYPDDPGCMSASDPTEVVDNPVACGASLMIKNLPPTGTDTGTLDSTSTSQIASPCGGGGGAAAIAYRINISNPTVIVANTAGSMFDTVLDLRSADCDDESSEVTCHDDISTSNKTSRLTASLAPGTYFLIVSGADTSELGQYSINVERFTGEGAPCTGTAQCGPGLVCRTAMGGSNTVCAVPQCADQYDDDGDGKPGFPTDPGCSNAADNDETDPVPAPACSNMVDDDNDGATDYPADTACSSAAGNSESCNGEQDAILDITSGTTSSTLVGTSNDHNASCDLNAGGPDQLLTLTVPQLRSLRIDTDTSSFDTVLSLLDSSCSEPSLACADQGGSTTNASLITRNNVAAGTYIVAVDAWSATTTVGPYVVHVAGVIAPGGKCDATSSLNGALACPATNPCMLLGTEMRCVPSACGDGMDNDNDGFTDFPLEPGCTSSEDTDESDTCANGPGPGCPECADGIDNDNDGQTDLDDTACLGPYSPSEGCISTDGITEITTASTADTTVGATNDTPPACAVGGTQTSPDKVYTLQLPHMRTLRIANSNSFDAIVALYDSSCGGTPRRCSDEPEEININNLPAGQYYYSVDGDGASASGSYTINVSGIIEANASCEGALAEAGAIVCPTGYTCRGPDGSRTCTRPKCGDGVDNDGDGVADFPNDPGCANALDDTEEDTCPAGPMCPACGDSIDNDMDGQTDFPDDGTCASAASFSEECAATETITQLMLPLTPDTTEGATDDVHPSCGSSTNTAPDKFYALTVPELATLRINNVNDFDAVVALYDQSCGPATLACSDTPEDLSFTNLPAGTYYYLVDGYSTQTGAYDIQISGTIKPGESCESPLAVTGALTCTSGYTCGGTAGSRTCVPTQCNDGVNNDSDTFTDYPFDPGCTSISDDDESDPCPGAGCPVCGDMIDNDSDMFIDYPLDPQCASASATSETCRASEGIPELTLPTTTGTTTGLVNDTAPTCGSNTNTAPDITYTLNLPALVNFRIVKTSSFDAVTAMYRDSCSTTALACTDSAPETINLTNSVAGTYYYVLDGFSSGSGTYEIAITGTIVNGESCESPLAQSGALTCGVGYVCGGTMGSRTCIPSQCSDGMDNDSDGLMDYPAEPGCETPDDNDETDPATAPVCANGVDDDMDGQTDYPGDNGCESASYPTEVFYCMAETNRPVRLITMNPTTGTTTGATNNFGSQTCQTNASGEDITLGLELPVPVQTLVLDLTNSAFDTVLSMRDATCQTEIGCADDQTSPSSTRSKLTASNVAAGAYSVIVDGWSGQDGNYSLTVTGTVASGTSCTSPLFAAGILACPSGTSCTGTPATCQ